MGCWNKLSKMDTVISWTNIPGMLKNANFVMPYIKFLPRYRDSENVKKITSFFNKKDALYIADGHHRSASSALLKKDLQAESTEHKGTENYNYFMSYLIPESNLKISEFNRFIKDLNGYTDKEFFSKLETSFIIKNHGSLFKTPTKKHEFSMYLNGEFFTLQLKNGVYNYSDALSKLDTEILYRTILQPILGIKDLQNNNVNLQNY